MKTSGMRVLMGVTAIGLLASMSFAINIETVTVGNAGNAADSRYGGYGSVGYTYNIGKYEVTAGQYCGFLNAVAKTDTYGLYNPKMDINSGLFDCQYGCNIKRSGNAGNYSYSVASDWANRPVNFVSWGDAARFTNWLHNGQLAGEQNASTTEDGAYALNGAMSETELLAVTRKSGAKWAIPTENEWYKAAYHKNDGVTGNYWDYPTSSNTAPGRDIVDASGNNANYWSNGLLISGPYYRTEVGEFQNSDSPYGTFDQGGNLWEWNETVIGSDYGTRGGTFFSYGSYMLASERIAGPRVPTFEHLDFGFRVIQVPEPTSILLLTLGGLALVRRKRR